MYNQRWKVYTEVWRWAYCEYGENIVSQIGISSWIDV